MHVLSLFDKCAHDLLMTGENDDLSALSELGQSASGACATVVVKVHQNVVGEHGNGGANFGRALELLTRAKRKKPRRKSSAE